jgi:hypothetical protein
MLLVLVDPKDHDLRLSKEDNDEHARVHRSLQFRVPVLNLLSQTEGRFRIEPREVFEAPLILAVVVEARPEDDDFGVQEGVLRAKVDVLRPISIDPVPHR